MEVAGVVRAVRERPLQPVVRVSMFMELPQRKGARTQGATVLETHEGIPIRRDMIERAIEVRSRSAGSGARAMAERVRQALFLPPHQPPVQRVLIGDDGRIWLQREETSEAAPPEWMILSPSGEQIGFVPMPVGFVPTSMAGNRALGVRSDSEGHQFIEIVEFRDPAG